MAKGGFDPACEEIGVNGDRLTVEHPQRDLRRRAVVGRAEDLPTRPGDGNGSSGRGASGVEDVADKDPGMPLLYSLDGLLIDADPHRYRIGAHPSPSTASIVEGALPSSRLLTKTYPRSRRSAVRCANAFNASRVSGFGSCTLVY